MLLEHPFDYEVHGFSDTARGGFDHALAGLVFLSSYGCDLRVGFRLGMGHGQLDCLFAVGVSLLDDLPCFFSGLGNDFRALLGGRRRFSLV